MSTTNVVNQIKSINEVKTLPGNKFEWTARIAQDTLSYIKLDVHSPGLEKGRWKSPPFQVPCFPCDDKGHHLWVMLLQYSRKVVGNNVTQIAFYPSMCRYEALNKSTDECSLYNVARFKGKKMKLQLHSKMIYHDFLCGQPSFDEMTSSIMENESYFSYHFFSLDRTKVGELNNTIVKQSFQARFMMTCEVGNTRSPVYLSRFKPRVYLVKRIY